MALQIYTELSLSHAQTILVLFLSILGFAWFFFLSNIVKFRALRLLKDTDKVPILETIVPTTIMDVYKVVSMLRVKWITPVVFTSTMAIIGLVLTSFEGIIVLHTIDYVESCGITTAKIKAQIIGDFHSSAVDISAEMVAMMNKRNKSGVPSAILVGQIPKSNRWKFDAHFDVDPYPWRSSCSFYDYGITQVNMNTSVLNGGSDLRETLPEVHANFIFRDSSDGYNYTRGNYESYLSYNSTNIADGSTYQTNGALILLIEELTRGNFDTVGMHYMNKLWTMRVPETKRIPFNPDNEKITGIVISVPIAIKVYTCDMERVKEGDYGSYNVKDHFISALVSETGKLVGRMWNLAVLSGRDTSIYELTPEYWASYLAVKDTQTSQVEEVSAKINTPCIIVHPAYISLICVYMLMFIIGMYLLIIRWRKHKKCKIPSSIIEWASFACKEYRANDNTEHDFVGYNLEVTSDNILKIKLENNSVIKVSRTSNNTGDDLFNLFNYNLGVTSDMITLVKNSDNTGHGLFGYNLENTSDNILQIKLFEDQEA